jgi:hypothetical protein
MIPPAARAVIRAALIDAGYALPIEQADDLAEQAADALTDAGWTLTVADAQNAPQRPA